METPLICAEMPRRGESAVFQNVERTGKRIEKTKGNDGKQKSGKYGGTYAHSLAILVFKFIRKFLHIDRNI